MLEESPELFSPLSHHPEVSLKRRVHSKEMTLICRRKQAVEGLVCQVGACRLANRGLSLLYRQDVHSISYDISLLQPVIRRKTLKHVIIY